MLAKKEGTRKSFKNEEDEEEKGHFQGKLFPLLLSQEK